MIIILERTCARVLEQYLAVAHVESWSRAGSSTGLAQQLGSARLDEPMVMARLGSAHQLGQLRTAWLWLSSAPRATTTLIPPHVKSLSRVDDLSSFECRKVLLSWLIQLICDLILRQFDPTNRFRNEVRNMDCTSMPLLPDRLMIAHEPHM
jgi:hypothetical protein